MASRYVPRLFFILSPPRVHELSRFVNMLMRLSVFVFMFSQVPISYVVRLSFEQVYLVPMALTLTFILSRSLTMETSFLS